MANKEDEGFFHSLSRKELQSLCKKYGLPANRSSSDMAKSLASYGENQRLGLMSVGGRLCGIQEAELPLSKKLQLQPGASLNSFIDTGKDRYGLISCPIDRCNGQDCSQAAKSNALDCCTGQKVCHKDGYSGGSIIFQQTPELQFGAQCADCGFKNKEFSTICFNRNCPSLIRDGKMNNMPEIELKDTNVGTCSKETAFGSCINTPVIYPSSFEFHVSSDQGINLFVDLNSNPSEWVEKLKSEVSICQTMSHSKSETFHNEIGRFGESSTQIKNSFQLDVDAGRIKDGHVHSGLTPSLTITENNQSQLDHPDGDIVSLGSTVMAHCATAVEVLEHLEGEQRLTLSKAPPDSQEQIISSGASSTKDVCLINLDSNINSPREKLAAAAVINISDGPLNILTTEHKNPNLENGIRENSTLPNGCNLVGPGGTKGLPIGSLQVPISEDVVHQKDILHSPCENDGFLELVDPNHSVDAEQDELEGSSELDQETFRNRLPTLVEEQGRRKIIDCEENSECSLDDLFENCGGLDKVKSDGLGKKRAYIDGDQNDCNLLDAKILRSAKNMIRKVLPRRSTRLVPNSKVLLHSLENNFSQQTKIK